MRVFRPALALTTLIALGLTACSTSAPTTTGDPDPVEPGETAAPEPTDEPTDVETEDEGDEGNGGTDGDVPAGDGTETIYLVSKGFQHRFWQAVRDGAMEAGEDYNYNIEFVGPDNEQAITQQIDQLTTAFQQGPVAIGFAALDTGAAQPVLEQIEAAGIPIIAFDSGVDSDIPVTTVSTDNEAAAAAAAEHMFDLIGGTGTVGLVCHDQTSATGQQRCNGFIDWMEANAPEVTVLPPQYAGEVGLAANTANSIIQANPDIAGIYGTNEAAAIGTIQGADESGADLVVIGFDSGQVQLDAVRSGQVAGSITQAPVAMGYETVVAAIRAINGIDQPEIIDSGFQWYDASNMDDPEIAPNLYE